MTIRIDITRNKGSFANPHRPPFQAEQRTAREKALQVLYELELNVGASTDNALKHLENYFSQEKTGQADPYISLRIHPLRLSRVEVRHLVVRRSKRSMSSKPVPEILTILTMRPFAQ